MKSHFNARKSAAINHAIDASYAGRMSRRELLGRLAVLGFSSAAAIALANEAQAASENQDLQRRKVDGGARSFDYIIVGAGSAGCVLANRLSADGSRRVLLIEAGGRNIDQDKIVVPGMWPANWGDQKTNYNYRTVPQPHAMGREITFDRGRILGGSSAINAMFWQRSDPRDYRAWEPLAGSSWGQEPMLDAFRALERFRGAPSPYRGTSGPMVNGPLPTNHPFAVRYVEAGVELGLPRNADFNGAAIDGVGFYDLNVDQGRRVSAAHAFVLPMLPAPNLTVLTDASVLDLILSGKRCTGVRVRRGNAIERFQAAEVILSAGAVNSPEILLRSGIGPAAELRQLGIGSAIDLPGVGRSLVDHVMVHNVVFTSRTKMPPISGNTSEAHAFVKSDPSVDVPDLQLIFEQLPIGNTPVPADRGYTVLVGLVRPHSVGSLKLRDARHGSPPLIDPNYLADGADMDRLVRGIEIARELGNARAFSEVRDAEFSPGKLGAAELRDFVRRNCATFWHPVGTCRMGTDAESVVDPLCRVHGAQGLRVVDASVMPRITTANTNAPTMMIAQKASEFIVA